MPVSFFIAAIGLSVGIGGASVLSRALGNDDSQKAIRVFGNQISITLLSVVTLTGIGLFFSDSLVTVFGGKGSIFQLAKDYYQIVLYGVPILAINMMFNNVLRAEGKPKYAMISMIIPSVSNLLFDYIFINQMNLGMKGAAWATTISYILCFSYLFIVFAVKSELRITVNSLILDTKITKEILALGGTTFARQATVSFVYFVVNNIIIGLEGELGVTVYAIVSRLLMFIMFPIIGVTQGFLPIAAYNFGAKKYDRIKQVVTKAITYAGVLGLIIFSVIMLLSYEIGGLFISNSDPYQTTELLDKTALAIRITFCMVPIVPVQLIGAAYYQAIGKALPAFLLTLSRQGIFLIPTLFILSYQYGFLGVWLAFPISDLLSTLITAFFVWRDVFKKKYISN